MLVLAPTRSRLPCRASSAGVHVEQGGRMRHEGQRPCGRLAAATTALHQRYADLLKRCKCCDTVGWASPNALAAL